MFDYLMALGDIGFWNLIFLLQLSAYVQTRKTTAM